MSEHESLDASFHEGNKRKYDPVKRHEYYECTKKLKGRKKGRQKNTFNQRPKAKSIIKSSYQFYSRKNSRTEKSKQ